MYPIWEILLAVSFQQTSFRDLKNSKDRMYYTYAELINMEQPLKSKPWKKRKLLKRYVTITTRYTLKYINGLTLALTILVEQVRNGILKLLRRYF